MHKIHINVQIKGTTIVNYYSVTMGQIDWE